MENAAKSRSSLNAPLISELISNFGLPKEVSAAYTRMGISRPFDWQVECLQKTNVMNGGNLVYCAPTGAGKTFIAEMAILQAIFIYRKKAILVLPYVSLVAEKLKHFTVLLSGYNRTASVSDRIKIASLHGGTIVNNINSVVLRSDIIVCTQEKASQILNILVSVGREHVIGCFVVDELHLIGDPFCGSSLEGLLLKLRYLSKLCCMIQVVAMSATVSNLTCLSDWLDAQLYVTNYRPISLSRYLVVEDKVQTFDGRDLRTLKLIPGGSPTISEQTGWSDLKWKHEALLSLSLDALENQKQVLIFCPTRSCCSDISFFLAQRLPDCNECAKIRRQEWRASLFTLENGSLNASERFLNSLLNGGVAIHHAGISEQERNSVEAAYLDGTIRLLVCTTTLAAGINLPANLVIIFSLHTGAAAISIANYQQMCGRAGRPGFQLGVAEAYLLATRNERQQAVGLMTSPSPSVVSQLHPRNNNRGATELKRLLMDAFALGLLKSKQDSFLFSQLSLAYFQENTDGRALFLSETEVCINYLLETSAVEFVGNAIEPTRFGRAVAKCGFFSDEVVIMYKELLKSQARLHLSSPLHLLYLVSPFSRSIPALFPDWALMYEALTRPTDSLNRKSSVAQLSAVLKLFGVQEGTLLNWKRNPPNGILSECFSEVRLSTVAAGQSTKDNPHKRKSANILPSQWCQLRVCIRAWEAWVLLALATSTEDNVISTFEIPNTAIRDLLKQTLISVRRTKSFCHEIGWYTLELLIAKLQPTLESIQVGNDKLRPLLVCSKITPQVALCLWEGDIKDCSMLSQASASHIAHMLQVNLKFISTVYVECNETAVFNACLTTSDEYRRERLLLFANRLKLSAKDALEDRDRTSAVTLPVMSCDIKSERFYASMDIERTDASSLDRRSAITLYFGTLTEEQWVSFSDKCQSVALYGKLKALSLPFPPSLVEHKMQSVIKMPKKYALSASQIVHFHTGFAMRHLRGQSHWQDFLKCAASAQCLSLQISMRRCPLSLIGHNPSCKSVPGLFSNLFLHRCHAQVDEDTDGEDWFTPGKCSDWISTTHAIAGVALCFGGPDAFYLPLPMPLPLLNSMESKPKRGMQVSPSMSNIPVRCRELICCYVGGYQTFLGAPPEGLERLNVCLFLNRAWASSARNALMTLWLKHGSHPWECLKDLLLDPGITIVGANLQTQIRLLRSRGVTRFRGPLEDPGVAVKLLKVNGRDLRIKLPNARSKCGLFVNLPKFACFTAIASLRSMAMLDQKLRHGGNILSLFRDVEMPLLLVAARSEQSGLPLSTAYIVNVQNEILDREFAVQLQSASEELVAESLELPEPIPIESKALFCDMDYFLGIETLDSSTNSGAYKFFKSDLAPSVVRVQTSWNFLDVNGDYSCVHSLQFKDDILTGVSASEGCSLLVVRYVDIEMRLLAHFSRDRILLSVCASEYDDIYVQLASIWTNVPPAELTASDCTAVKVILFVIMHGLALSEVEAAGVPYSSCLALFKAFEDNHPEASRFLKSLNSGGISMTILGRSIKNTFDTNGNGFAVITGSVLELMKIALLSINPALEQFADCKSDVLMHNSCPALVFLKGGIMVYEAQDSDLSAIEDILRVCLENVAVLHVPLKINVEIRRAEWNNDRTVRV
jgi:replicative superfamily II helicase